MSTLLYLRDARDALPPASWCLMVNLTPAGIADSTRALAVLETLTKCRPGLGICLQMVRTIVAL